MHGWIGFGRLQWDGRFRRRRKGGGSGGAVVQLGLNWFLEMAKSHECQEILWEKKKSIWLPERKWWKIWRDRFAGEGDLWFESLNIFGFISLGEFHFAGICIHVCVDMEFVGFSVQLRLLLDLQSEWITRFMVGGLLCWNFLTVLGRGFIG